jgi:hypothetical protein
VTNVDIFIQLKKKVESRLSSTSKMQTEATHMTKAVAASRARS